MNDDSGSERDRHRYLEAVEFMYSLVRHGTKYGLANIRTLLEMAGRLSETRNCVHVLGTNGKGSVSAMTGAALRRCGHRTGVFTSPHLTVMKERFAIDGDMVTDSVFASGVDWLRRLIEEFRLGPGHGEYPSFFESALALGLGLFNRAECDAMVLEAGLGGEFDATTACGTDVTVITNVALDHTKTLGPNLRAIAKAKGGAIRAGVPVVCNDPRPYVRKIISSMARERGAEYFSARDIRVRNVQDPDPFVNSFELPGMPEWGTVSLKLPGTHQIENARTSIAALACLKSKGMDIPPAMAAKGLSEAAWPGRLEIVSRDPMVLLDGAHNPAGADTLAEFLNRVRPFVRKVHCLMGVLGDKDSIGLFSRILPHVDTLHLSRPKNWRSVPPETHLGEALKFIPSTVCIPEIGEAWQRVLALSERNDMILACGSLYLIGELRGIILGIPGDPPSPKK